MNYALVLAFGMINAIYAREFFPPPEMTWQQQAWIIAMLAVTTFALFRIFRT